MDKSPKHVSLFTVRRIVTILTVLALVCVCALLMPTKAEAVTVQSGACGEKLTWVLDDSGTLTISGSGAMDNYEYWGGLQENIPWYSYQKSVKKIVIKSGVTTIGNSAFAEFKELESVTIADSVVSIGEGAFDHCVKLPQITLPANLTEIKSLAFQSCKSLTTLEFPEGLVTIGDMAFMGCFKLTAIQLPDSLTYLGSDAFVGAPLKGITIPDKVQTISSSLFVDCKRLEVVVFPKGLKQIDEHIFDAFAYPDTIYFRGTEEEWANISIHENNEPLKKAKIVYEYTGCGHHWDNEVTVKEATCKEPGMLEYTCIFCGESKNKEILQRAHTFGDAVVTAESTCSQAGSITRTCTVCRYEETEVVPMKEHTPGAPATETEDQTCTVCGAVLEPAMGELVEEPQVSNNIFTALWKSIVQFFRLLFWFLY